MEQPPDTIPYPHVLSRMLERWRFSSSFWMTWCWPTLLLWATNGGWGVWGGVMVAGNLRAESRSKVAWSSLWMVLGVDIGGCFWLRDRQTPGSCGLSCQNICIWGFKWMWHDLSDNKREQTRSPHTLYLILQILVIIPGGASQMPNYGLLPCWFCREIDVE